MTFVGFFGSTTFQFTANVNFRFGYNVSNTLATELAALGVGKPLLLVDPALHENGITAPLVKALEAARIQFSLCTEVEQNPRDISIHAIFDGAATSGCDSVVGVGGGSAMDTAKGVALLMSNGGAIADYDGTNKVGKDLPPVVAIPTTAGTGSEVTANAALTRSTDHYKMSLRSPRLLPKLAILDPALLRTLPRSVAATSGLDALTHAVEGYLSVRASPFSDFFAIRAMELLARNIRAFVANPENLEASSAMLMGSMLAGMVVSNTGTGNDHALARALGGLCDVAHGTATGMLLPHVMAFNATARPERYVDIASAIGVSTSGAAREVAARVVEEIHLLLRDLEVPLRLRDVGVAEDRIPALVEIAVKNVGPNPRRTGVGDLEKILRSAC